MPNTATITVFALGAAFGYLVVPRIIATVR